MTPLQPTPGRRWWAKTPTTLIYFIREINGILLGILAFAIIICTIIFQLTSANIDFIRNIFIWIFFAVACIHSITWFIALPKILPFELPPSLQKAEPLFIIVLWLILSWLIIHYLFIK